MGFAYVEIPASPLAPGATPVRLRYREFGAGAPLMLLHGGWGFDVYPFDLQIAALESTHRILAPDRSGYGGSGRLRSLPADFHQSAAAETVALLDALGVERTVLWGHSDGAVIALWVGIMAPERVAGIIAEATHFFRGKPGSREFFETMRAAPEKLGDRVTGVLAHDHGERWRDVIRLNGEAWLQIGAGGGDTDDLYRGRLCELRAATLIIHGGRDPRTEPGELEALGAALQGRSGARRSPGDQSGDGDTAVMIFPEGGHSPHSQRATGRVMTPRVADWLRVRRACVGTGWK